MPARSVIAEPRAAETPTVSSEQIRRDATFIEKDVLPGVAERQPVAPAAARGGDVRTPLLVGVYRFF
jgi:hypothetical protein